MGNDRSKKPVKRPGKPLPKARPSSRNPIVIRERIVREFADAHMYWDDHQWRSLLGDLEAAGVDATDTASIGLLLEKMRLRRVLSTSAVKGVGPKRIEVLVERYASVWNLIHADPAEVGRVLGGNAEGAAALQSHVRRAMNHG